MLWYEILLICLGCFIFGGFNAFFIYLYCIDGEKKNIPTIGVATHLFHNIYFTSIKHRLGYYKLTTKDGVYLLPINNTKIHLYKEKDYEKQN